MACDLTLGRKEPCKDVVGGIKNIYFVDFGDLTLTFDASPDVDVVSSVGTSVENFKYEVKGNSSLEQTVNSSRENGTTFYESTLNITFQNLDVATQEEIKLLNRGRAHYVVELYPDGTGTTKYLLLGKDNGAEVTSGSILTGAAAGDLQGFTLTAVASEVNPPFFATAPDESATTPITPA